MLGNLLAGNNNTFKDIKAFCMFIAYPRSGHSLYGALLDAHPSVAISHELNALQFMLNSPSREKLFRAILKKTSSYAKEGLKNEGYSYRVENQFQGSYKSLKLIGDKRGGRTSRMLSENFDLLNRFQDFVQIEVRLLHVYRNPFDNIASRSLGGKLHKKKFSADGLKSDIDKHFIQLAVNQKIREDRKFKVLDVKHEDFVSDPRTGLTKIAGFFEIELFQDWIEDCAAIVFDKPNKTRHAIPWNEEALQLIYDRISKYDFLRDYTFNN